MTSFTADMLELAIFPFVMMCEIDRREGTENLALIHLQLWEVSRNNDRKGGGVDKK